ncbi:RHS repeat-associated core domain-containing protein, partial [Pseudomonas anuradhapurensis]
DDGDTGRTVHYLYEPGSFVPVAQALRKSPIRLHKQPDWSQREYDFDQDPLWHTEVKPQAFDAIAWYQCDHLGTPMELTDEHGHIAWAGQYKAWGEVKEERSDWARQHGLGNPIRFQGQYHDHETGLHYNRYRYYDPRPGRFINQDPIGYVGGWNLYQYATNPVNWVDPLGLNPCCPSECDKILEAEGVVTGRHGDLKRIGGLQDSHHIYQDAAMKGISGYGYNDAPAISLQGRNPDGTTRGTPHYRANRTQDNASTAGVLGSETVVAYNSLRSAGLSPMAAKCATLQARKYFTGIGSGAGTTTQTPSKRTRNNRK